MELIKINEENKEKALTHLQYQIDNLLEEDNEAVLMYEGMVKMAVDVLEIVSLSEIEKLERENGFGRDKDWKLVRLL